MATNASLATAQIADTSFLLIPPVTYQMGDKNHQPIHRVVISNGFLLQKTEVTQAQWIAVMKNNPSVHKDCGATCPVENVSWEDVQTFIAELNLRSPGKTYRLPTEAEWELAAQSMSGGGGPFQAWISETFVDHDPKGPATGNEKVIRGGAFDYVKSFASAEYRRSETPNAREGDVGFRLVRAQ